MVEFGGECDGLPWYVPSVCLYHFFSSLSSSLSNDSYLPPIRPIGQDQSQPLETTLSLSDSQLFDTNITIRQILT